MYSKYNLFELKNAIFKTKHHFLCTITKVLQVVNFSIPGEF